MQEILDAITAGATGDDIANIDLPESYRAAHVLRSEQDMFEEWNPPTRTPVGACTWARCRCPNSHLTKS
ncbi:MAG: hypothetical protein M5U19_02160 [Microthrixaceae bacterium]|nr:hypothetical protein [Microthrixaceae bacterium]